MKYLLAAMLLTTPAAAAPFNEQWAAIMEDLQIMELNYHGNQPRAVKTDRIKFEDRVLQPADKPPAQKSIRKKVAKADVCARHGQRKVMIFSKYKWRCREA